MDGSGPDFHVMAAANGTSGLPVWSLAAGGPLGHVFHLEFVHRKDCQFDYTPKISAILEAESFSPLSNGPTDVIDIDLNWERMIYDEPVDLAITPSLFGIVDITERFGE
jgi:hypothetical protein